jgi:hypothetical protein
MSEATPGAGLVTGLANAEQFTDVSKAVFPTTDATGALTQDYTIWSKTVSNGSACPPAQEQANAGLTCTLAVADFSGNSQGAVELVFSGQPMPAAPVLHTNAATYLPGGTVTLSGSGFYGTPMTGSPDASAVPFAIPAATVLLDGTPVTNQVTTSAATWPDAMSDSLTAGGVLGGNLAVTLPGGASLGTHTITVIQPNTTPYPGPGATDAANHTITQSVNFKVASTLPPSITLTPNTNVKNGGTITVVGKNFPANKSVAIVECGNPNAGEAGCDTNNVDLKATTNGSGGFTSAFSGIHTGNVGTAASAKCAAGNICWIAATTFLNPSVPPPASQYAKASFTFAKAAPTIATKTTASKKNGHVVGKVAAGGKGISGLKAYLEKKVGSRFEKIATLKTGTGGKFSSKKLKKGKYEVKTPKQSHNGHTYGASHSTIVTI